MWADVKRLSAILSLAGLLTTIYFLSYTGSPISDDEQLYASAARNIDVLGRLSAEQLYGDVRLKGDYHGVEPAHPALASLWLRLFRGTDLGLVQLLYLLPIIYSIISSVFMLALTKRLGYSISAGLLIALFCGLGTMTWPYAKTFLREPLGGMLMLGGWLFYITARQEKGWKRIICSLLFIIAGAILVLIKVVYSSIWIAFFIMWYFEKREKPGIYFFSKTVQRISLFMLVALFGWMLYSLKFTDADLYYRISGGFIHDAFERLFSISHAHFLDAIFAPLFSPFKGLFIYSPILILSLVSLFLNWKKGPQLFTLPLTVLLALILVQALAYDSEWWSSTWGARFLLPAIPLLLIMSLPLIDDLLNKFKWGRLTLAVMFISGFVLQLPAVLFNSSSFFVRTYDYRSVDFSKIFWDFSRSPLLLQWRMFDNPEFDLLIWRVYPYQPIFVVIFVVTAVLFAAISLRWLYFDFLNSVVSTRVLQYRALLSSFFIVLLVCGVLFLGRYDPFYRAHEFKPLCDLLYAKIRPGDVVVIYSYPGDLWDYFSNAECGQNVWYSLPYRYYENLNFKKYQMGVDLFSTIATGGYSRLWFISQYDTNPLSDFEKAEFESNHYYLLNNGYVNTPVLVYYSLYQLR